MDLWLIAGTAATRYITNHLQNVSRGKENFPESSSEDLISTKLESPRYLVSKLVRDQKPNEENFEDCIIGENLDVCERGNVHGVDVAAGSEEICSDSLGNRAFLRSNQRYRKLIKPFSVENSVMSRLYREKMSMEDNMRSPFPSPCASVSRPLVVTDGTKVISKNNGDFISQRAPNCGIPRVRKLESSVLYVKRRTVTEKSVSGRSDNGIGSNDAALLLCVGISIGIMSSFVANQTKANKVKSESKETENLVKESEDELKTKDSLTLKGDLHDGGKQCNEKTADNSESISEIEAELEAELERLEMDMNSSNIEARLSDVFELEPDFEVVFAQGELRDDRVKRQRFDETESDQEPSGKCTPTNPGNYPVSPRELSLRLHKVINSRYEERIKELEIALQESQRKVEQLVMEAEEKKKPFSSHEDKRDSVLPVSAAHTDKKHNLAEIQPLVVNLAGPALDAFNDSYEELMDINDYCDESDLPYEMQENERQEELSLTSKSSPWSHKDYRKDSSRTSEDVNLFRLQDLLGLSDEEEEEEEEEDREFESEMEKQLIKQIVEKTKQGSSAVFNAQKMLFLMEETEQNP